MSQTNRDRAARAGLAIFAHQLDDNYGSVRAARREIKASPAAILSYLLADLRHWCDVRGFDFAKIDKQAYLVYLDDRLDERQERRQKAKARR